MAICMVGVAGRAVNVDGCYETVGLKGIHLEPLTKPFNKAQADNGTRQRQQGEMDIQPSLETNS